MLSKAAAASVRDNCQHEGAAEKFVRSHESMWLWGGEKTTWCCFHIYMVCSEIGCRETSVFYHLPSYKVRYNGSKRLETPRFTSQTLHLPLAATANLSALSLCVADCSIAMTVPVFCCGNFPLYAQVYFGGRKGKGREWLGCTGSDVSSLLNAARDPLP